MSIEFKNLQLGRWRQFGEVEIPLDRQVTVLTGPNGCGKTTILNTLSKHFGWNIHLVSTPFLSKRQKKSLWSEFGADWLEEQDAPAPAAVKVGEIEYSSGAKCTLHVPPNAMNNPHYSLQYQGQQAVIGLHIPSHRPSITYHRVSQIPTDPKGAQQHYQEFNQLLLQTYGSDSVRNPGLVLKQSLIALGVFGPGNEAVAPNPVYRELFEAFQEVLRTILPSELGFERLQIRMPDVVLVTKTGSFALDAMSGGVSSLFGIAWQIHMFAAEKGNCTVVFDEPENHLHPSMQRTLLPSLASAFPNHRFVVATHSPFVVTSHPEGRVVGLTFREDRRIESQLLTEADLAGSPNKVLREILDVPTTLPVWVEQRIRDILQKHGDEADGAQKAKKIFDDLKEQGLGAALGYFDPGDGQ